jgi:tol-pal system protein YbgF
MWCIAFGFMFVAQTSSALAQVSDSDLVVRLNQLENKVRQLTGTIEQLEYRNQQLEQQLRAAQLSASHAAQPTPAMRPSAPQPMPSSPVAAPPPPNGPIVPGRRSDAFDPTEHPNAPGVPRALGSMQSATGLSVPGSDVQAVPPSMGAPIGAPGGRQPGAPLDLSTLSDQASNETGMLSPPGFSPGPNGLPPPQAGNSSNAGVQQATLPPSATPRDEYDLAYGYVLRKDYALAEDGLRAFLKRYPSDRMVSDAHYWLGESLFQRQRYRDAAESFLTVSTKFETAPKAPDALLRLGQSLAALNEKEAACATLAEIGRKYPRASVNVKQGVEREQKRVRC